MKPIEILETLAETVWGLAETILMTLAWFSLVGVIILCVIFFPFIGLIILLALLLGASHK